MVEYTAAQLADALKPFIVRWIPAASPVSSPGVGGSLLSHDISGVLHTGTISLSQAPWALPIDGSRSITGNLSVDPGVTVDGVDISAHAADVNAHHAQSHSLATTAGLGADHTVSGLTAGQVLRATGATTAAFASIQDADLPSTIVRTSRNLTAGAGLTGTGTLASDVTFAVGAGAGITVNADDVALTTPGSLSATSTNSSTGSHTHAIDSTIARSAITLTAGNGFAAGSGGDLTANRTFTLGTPGALSATTTDAVTTNSHTHSISTATAATLTVSTTNAAGTSASLARADHTHAITSSSNPGAAASILASSAAGALTLVDMTVTSLTASRLVVSDANDKLTSVSALSTWIAGTANRITVSDDGDGSITLSSPQDIHTSATPTFGGLIAPWLRPAADSTTALQLRTSGGTAVLTIDTTNSRVGIGNTPAAYKLDVTGDVRLTGTLYADGGILDLGTDYFQEGVTYLELKGAKPFYLNQTIQASGWSMSAGGALVSSSSLSAASLALTGAATVGGNFTVGTTVLQVNTAGTRVGINRTADSQFDLDVAGAIRGQWLVGKHAIQLSMATAVVHFDGPAPYNLDFTGSNASHAGEGATETGGVIYRPGKYGKAVQMGQATTNLHTNPSFDSVTTGFTYYNGSTAAVSTADALYGSTSLLFTTGVSNIPYGYANRTTGLATGQSYTFSLHVKAANTTAVGKTFRMILRENASESYKTEVSYTVTTSWQRVQVTRTLTHATPTELNYYFVLNSTGGDGSAVYIDAVQLEQLAYATPYCDGSLGQGHSWSGTAHASTSSRTATKLEYPIRMVNPQAGTIMMWVKVDGYNSNGGGLWGWGSGNAVMDAFINSSGTMVSRVGGATPSSVASFGTGVWRHVAWTWDAAANKYRVFVDGLQQPQPTPVDYSYTAQAVHATALAVGGIAALSSTYSHNGLIDEFVLLDYAADPKLIRAIYESDAPVFVESSVFHWRSPSKVPIWVDEFGLWARGVSGGAILGLYGGDPRTVGATTSWGGITMEENDIVIGRTSAPSYTALHWDDSAGELILGRQAAEHVSLVSGSVRIKNATTVYADLSGSTFVLGNVAEENLRLTTSGIEFRNATEVQGSLSATTWTLGKTTGNHVLITATSLDIKYGSTAKISLDASGNASIAGVLSIGASGGIYQGTGTFASPTTGLKIWNDSSVGRIGGYNSGTIQWYAGTDGKLYAGAGTVSLGSDGVAVEAPTSLADKNGYRFASGSTVQGGLWAYSSSNAGLGVSTRLHSNANHNGDVVNSDRIGELSLLAKSTSTYDAVVSITASNTAAGAASITLGSQGSNNNKFVNILADTISLYGSGNSEGTVFINGSLLFKELSAAPTDPTSGTRVRLYMKGDKIIIQYNDAGTVRYKYLDLTGTGVTWVHTTTAP